MTPHIFSASQAHQAPQAPQARQAPQAPQDDLLSFPRRN